MVIEFKTAKERKMQENEVMQKKVSGSDIVTARLKGKCDCYGPWFHN